MNLQMTMTFGDVLVTASVVVAVVIGYYGLKALMNRINEELLKIAKTVDEHDDILVDHGEGIAALEAHMFGRRRQDTRHRNRS